MTAPDITGFERRHARWAELQRDFGPIRSFPYAWRLPDLARRAGGGARFRAALALAETLIAMGRHGEALAALPGDDEPHPAGLAAPLRFCRACCLAWSDVEEEAHACLEAAVRSWTRPIDGLAARARFAFLANSPDPQAGLAYLQAALDLQEAPHLAHARLLADWAQPGTVAPGELHQSLAWLRRHAPAKAAEAETCYAEARLRQTPAEALVWLDLALEQVERFGVHGLKPRLLYRKSQSLEAGGQLRDASRFLELAHTTARRLGAWRELRAMPL